MSTHVVPMVLVYDNHTDTAAWVTPAQATLLTIHNPCIEEIAPLDANYDVVAKLAGEKPVVHIRDGEVLK